MSNRTEKPMRSPAELVAMLRDEKGITFHYMSESEAEQYLTDRNNYLRTASYRKNYDKHRTGGNAGKYIRLDFAYLVELSKLDMYLRARLLPMCIDLEHALKVRILADIEENTAENGYDIAASFLSSNPDIMKTIAQKADSIFTGDLIDKYFSLCYVFDAGGNIRTEIQDTDCPVWVLVELLAFKDFTRFLRYYCSRYPGRISINFNHLYDPKLAQRLRAQQLSASFSPAGGNPAHRKGISICCQNTGDSKGREKKQTLLQADLRNCLSFDGI